MNRSEKMAMVVASSVVSAANLTGKKFKTVEEIDMRKTGGPLIPKGTKGVVEKTRRSGEIWVNFERFGHMHLYVSDVEFDGEKTAAMHVAYVDLVREVRGVRKLLSEARRQMAGIMRANSGDRELAGLMVVAGKALDEAVNGVDGVIGVAMGSHLDVMSSEDSGKRVAGFVWNDVKTMRLAVESMAAKCSEWAANEKEAVSEGRAMFDFSRHYLVAQNALDDCSMKLSHVERVI